jgi:hypothetical protein
MTTTTAAPRWRAEFTAKPGGYTYADRQTGEEKWGRVVVRRVVLTRDSGERLAFKVGLGRDRQPVFTDDRETRTGAAAYTNRGPLPGGSYCKPGPVRKYTATGWAAEVERLIGPGGVDEVFVKLFASIK